MNWRQSKNIGVFRYSQHMYYSCTCNKKQKNKIKYVPVVVRYIVLPQIEDEIDIFHNLRVHKNDI